LKIAVYSIALNEEKHLKRWYDSAKGADLILIADTGSTDKTRELARALGITVFEISVKPWRFDVARNASLALIPEDIDLCIQLDLDEVLQDNWRPVLEDAWAQGNTWPIYKHVTERRSDGSIRSFQNYFKIHPREGFVWKYPIHEIVTPKVESFIDRKTIDLEVDHLQDKSKSRKSYLDLLELAVLESPNDWRMNHYLNREYLYVQNWVKVLSSAYKAMEIGGGWDVERASTCMWASEAAKNLEFGPLMKEWAERATVEAPEFYEAWHWRAHISHLMADWNDCYTSASKILTLRRQEHHLVKPAIWEWWGYDLIALSSHNLGNAKEAIKFGQLAIDNSPDDQRLQKNMEYYRNDLKQ